MGTVPVTQKVLLQSGLAQTLGTFGSQKKQQWPTLLTAEVDCTPKSRFVQFRVFGPSNEQTRHNCPKGTCYAPLLNQSLMRIVHSGNSFSHLGCGACLPAFDAESWF